MDLIQLMPAQVTPQDVSVNLMEINESSSQQDDAAFPLIMETLLESEPISASLPEQVALPELANQDETDIGNLQMQECHSLQEEVEETDDDPSLDHKMDLPINEPVQLAWFTAELFEPPSKTKSDGLQQDEQKENSARETQVNFEKNEAGELVSPDSKGNVDLNKDKTVYSEPVPFSGSSVSENGKNKLSIDSMDIVTDLSEFHKINELPVDLNAVSNWKATESSATTIKKDNSQLIAMIEKNILTGKVDSSPALSSHPAMVSQEITVPKYVPESGKFELAKNITDPEWSNEFNQQIVWLGHQNIKTAIIKLNPQELGPIEVSVNVVKENATLNITTHTVLVRDAIEYTIPQLREMMSEQGLNLSQVNIDSNNNQKQPESHNSLQRATEERPDREEDKPLPRISKSSKGLVDYFA